jgi:hypothetical protein
MYQEIARVPRGQRRPGRRMRRLPKVAWLPVRLL